MFGKTSVFTSKKYWCFAFLVSSSIFAVDCKFLISLRNVVSALEVEKVETKKRIPIHYLLLFCCPLPDNKYFHWESHSCKKSTQLKLSSIKCLLKGNPYFIGSLYVHCDNSDANELTWAQKWTTWFLISLSSALSSPARQTFVLQSCRQSRMINNDDITCTTIKLEAAKEKLELTWENNKRSEWILK